MNRKLYFNCNSFLFYTRFKLFFLIFIVIFSFISRSNDSESIFRQNVQCSQSNDLINDSSKQIMKFEESTIDDELNRDDFSQKTVFNEEKSSFLYSLNSINNDNQNDLSTKINSINLLNNYDMQIGANYEWIDATNGYLLPLDQWDSEVVNLSLPFEFQFYDQLFSFVNVYSFGCFSFGNSSSMFHINPEFPSTDPLYHYTVALYWCWLCPDNNIFALNLTNPNRLVIEYHNVHEISMSIGGAGSFEVIFYENGDILFQYDYIDKVPPATVGLNYGLDPAFYNTYSGITGSTDNLAIYFTRVPPNHDLVVDLNVPYSLKTGDSAILNATVENRGANNESSLELQLWIDNELKKNQTYDNLFTGESRFITYEWLQPINGIYNITCYAIHVSGETNLANNIITKFTTVSHGISLNLGDHIDFKIFNPDLIDHYWFNCSYAFFITDYLVNISISLLPNITSWIVVDIITCEIIDLNNSQPTGQYYPFQIETSTLYLGATINYWSSIGIVTGETTYLYNDQLQDVWIIEIQDSDEVNYYDKNTGVLLHFSSTNSLEEGNLIDTNIIPSVKYAHEIKLELELPILPDPGENVIINITVSNIGRSNESNIEVHLWIDNIRVKYDWIELLAENSSEIFIHEWRIQHEGIYNVTAYVLPVYYEMIKINNKVAQNISVFQLNNYYMQVGSNFDWIDATVGNLLPLNDDDSIQVDFPFNFRFYDNEFTSIYVSSNGWLSFYNPFPNSIYNQSFPSKIPSHNYAVSLFWNNLMPEGNIYVLFLNNPNRVVIEYHNIDYSSGTRAGRFEVIFYENGDILFQYDFINIDAIPIVGLNYGLNLEYYNTYNELTSSTENLAILFYQEEIQTYITTTVLYPNGGEILSGIVTISWVIHTNTIDNVTHSIYLWNGTSWINTIQNLNTTHCIWDTTFVEDRNDYKIKIVSKTSLLTSEDESNYVFEVKNNKIPVTISALFSFIIENIVSLVTNPFFYIVLAELGGLFTLIRFIRKKEFKEDSIKV